MIDEHTINEYFKQPLRFYSSMYLNSKQRFEVDHMIDEHTTNE